MAAIRGLKLIRGAAMAPRLARADDSAAADDAGAAGDDEGMPTMSVEFSRFGTWYEINSYWEGRFLERTQRGSFKKTIKESGAGIKVLFNHGSDMQIGQKALGVPSLIEERETSPYMEVPLLDTSYNRDLVPGLRAGAYGSSFMFEVLQESWDHEPAAADHNPEGLPERTITQVRLFEAGPVTWPANPDATAGLRCGTDWLMDVLAERDADRHRESSRDFDAFRALHGLRIPSDEETAAPRAPHPVTPASGTDRHVEGLSAAARARRLRLIDIKR